MFYARNKHTGEHQPNPAMSEIGLSCDWEIIKADADGWIPWDACEGAKSPFIGNRTGAGKAKMRLADGDIVDSVLHWDDRPMERRRVIAYRPILDDKPARASSTPVMDDYRDSQKASAVEWNGEGLPPVGARTEYRAKQDTRWTECVVVFSSEYYVIVESVCDGSKGAQISIDVCGREAPLSNELHPIRTDAQRAEGEAVEAMANALEWIISPHCLRRVGRIYEAIREGRIPGVKLED